MHLTGNLTYEHVESDTNIEGTCSFLAWPEGPG